MALTADPISGEMSAPPVGARPPVPPVPTAAEVTVDAADGVRLKLELMEMGTAPRPADTSMFHLERQSNGETAQGSVLMARGLNGSGGTPAKKY